MNPSDNGSSQPSPRLFEALSRCNRTELYQICKLTGAKPPPGASRDDLIGYLTGVMEPSKETNDVDLWRRGLKGFVQDHWQILQPQLTCPIRQDIDACHRCLDVQVVSCVVEQGENEPLIQIHRK